MNKRASIERRSLIRRPLKASGVKKMSESAMRRAMSLTLGRLPIRGEPMQANVSSTFLMMSDLSIATGS